MQDEEKTFRSLTLQIVWQPDVYNEKWFKCTKDTEENIGVDSCAYSKEKPMLGTTLIQW